LIIPGEHHLINILLYFYKIEYTIKLTTSIHT
jgi:hypothetical protein